MTNAEANGAVFMTGSVFTFIGVWIVWSFGPAILTLGASWMAIGLIAGFVGDD